MIPSFPRSLSRRGGRSEQRPNIPRANLFCASRTMHFTLFVGRNNLGGMESLAVGGSGMSEYTPAQLICAWVIAFFMCMLLVCLGLGMLWAAVKVISLAWGPG